MNAPASFPSSEALSQEVRDTFIVFELDDRYHASLCFGADDAREMVSYSKHPASVRVHRITEGEIVRDVTADFVSEPDEDDRPINHTAAMRRAGAFSR